MSPDSKSNKEHLPDQDWDRRPVLVVGKQDRCSLARAKCRDEVPLVIEEVLVTGEVEEPDEGDHRHANESWKQPPRLNVANSRTLPAERGRQLMLGEAIGCGDGFSK